MAEPNFEKDLERLEALVAELEEGGLSLDTALKRFEEGIKLWRRCEKALAAAEKRIEILTKDAKGNIEARPFGDEDEEVAEEVSPGEPEGEADEEDAEDDELLF